MARWSIIAIYVVFTTVIGLLFIRRAGGNVAECFVAGRNLPCWLAGTSLAGTSLAATSFAADTPLFVGGLIATMGIAGNWLWWNQVIAWALAIVFLPPLWRRSGVITDAEHIEIRYGGRTAALLRGFRALHMPVIYSTFTVAWVMLAMQEIVHATIAPPAWTDGLQQFAESALGQEPGSVDVWKWTVLLGLFLVATPIWITVTLLTKPVAPEHLKDFYRKVRPPSMVWQPIAVRCPEVTVGETIVRILFRWLLSAVCLYASMFALGKTILLELGDAAVATGFCIISALLLWKASQAPNNGVTG